MEDRPWAEWSRGKPMTKNQLARVLGAFGVKPRQVRANGKNLNGYTLHLLNPVSSRYLASTTLQPLPDKGLRVEETFTEAENQKPVM